MATKEKILPLLSVLRIYIYTAILWIIKILFSFLVWLGVNVPFFGMGTTSLVIIKVKLVLVMDGWLL